MTNETFDQLSEKLNTLYPGAYLQTLSDRGIPMLVSKKYHNAIQIAWNGLNIYFLPVKKIKREYVYMFAPSTKPVDQIIEEIRNFNRRIKSEKAEQLALFDTEALRLRP